MFDKNNRYITKGVENQIPLELQSFLWNYIDKLKEQGKVLDYLQVFELKEQRADDIFYQNIEHRQEVPEYKKTHKIIEKEMINATIFVIDDESSAVTMMLAMEY